jgi:Lipase (class 3)
VKIETAIAPSVKRLRPARDQLITDGFPVYKDLPGTLAGPDPARDEAVPAWPPAHILATSAAYSYGDADTVATIMARMGLEDNRCLSISQEVDAMLITSTAYLLQSRDGATVVLSYRGTRPLGLIDVVGDTDFTPERFRVDLGGRATEVHSGFYRNVRSTRAEVIAALDRAVKGESIIPEDCRDQHPDHTDPDGPMRDLYITGHSLGGAMASLMAVLLATETEPARQEIAATMRTVQVFASPMVGSPEFAEAADALAWPGHPSGGSPAGIAPTLRDHVIRWVYRNDVVPRFPPSVSGPYRHLGIERRHRGHGRWEQSPASTQLPGLTGLAELALAPLAIVADAFEVTRDRWFGPSFADHAPEHYVNRLAPPDVLSEFGD